ncbi:MAG: S8 family serine peptidase, partial [Thermoplasmata archaeon]|nr:S8 family serine peptidase [Thermoplasmata archaeon]
MLNVVKKWQSVLVVVVLFASSFSLLASSIPTSLSDIEDASYDTQIGTIEDDSDMSKIQPSLSAKIYDEQKGMVKIFVPTLDVSELYGLLKEYRYQGLIGDRVGSSGELAIPTLEVPISLVTKIASLDSVIGVYEYPSTISKDRLLESIYDGENSDGLYGIPDDEPMSLYDAKHHNLEQAWSDGYTGTGVIVGMPDSGVDFGHPDLRGTQARVPAVPATVTAETVVALADEGQDNATLAHGNVIPGSETIYLNETATTAFTIDYATGALTFTTALAFNVTVTADYQYNSPYVGWPMAFDPASLGTYLDTERANGTWYVNTSYNTTAITIPADVVIDSDAEWDTYLEIINETVYGPAVGNGIERIFYLDHEDIVLGTYTLYIKDGAAWIKLVNDIHYELYPSTGKIKLTSDYGVLNSGMILYAYYNYTNPNINLVTEGVPTPTEGGTPQSMVVSGLEPGVPYSFAIKTKDEADNIGGMSNSPAGTAGIDSVLPGGIVDLTVEPSEDHSSVLINWTAPGDDGNEVGTTVTEYIVKYSTLPISNRVCFDYIDPEFTFTIEGNLSAGGKESRVISGTDDLRLPPGERLYFAIVGVDEAGNRGEISNCPPPVYVKNDIFPPAAITDLSAEIGFQHGEVNLTWTAPGDDGADGTAMGYTIKYSMSPITTEVEFDAALPVPLAAPIPQSGGSTEEFVVTGLGAGLTYYFAVETFDETDPMAVVQGILSSGPSLFAEAMDDSISPGQITDLNAVPGPNHASVRLFWNATGDDGAVGQATKYVIKYNTVDVYASASTYDPGLVDTWTPNTAGGAEEFVLERTMFGPISANTFYYFWVQAVDDGFRMGTPSASASATSTNDTIAPEAINDLSTAVADNHGYIILEWTAPHEDGGIGGACKQYVIKHSETPIIDEATFAAAAPLYLANPLDPGATETHLISLIHLYTPGTTLYFAIKAVDEAVSYGPLDLPSLPVSDVLRDDTIAPSTIGNLVATTADNNGEVVLNWTAPGDDDATGTASSYVIKYRKAISEYKEVAFEKKQFGVINPTYKDVMYNVTGIPTLDGVYRLGIHPDPNLALANGMAEEVPPVYNYSRVLLVVDPSGLDVVYVDLDFDQDFSDEKPCFFGDEVAWAEWVNDEGDDELRSGGMIYFISDGTTPIPYSDVYCDRYGLDNVIPGDDEMVCFFGEFGEGAISGTERASVIVGQGRLDSDLADPDIYNQAISQGIAPEAKIMAVTDSMFDGWYFTVEGYDGTPGTGDEAQIVSTGASIDVYENGWDFYSKFLDWLTYIYSDGRTSFVAGSGDTPGGGYGFGTINAPGASPAVITAGSGIDYYYRTGLTGPGGEKYDGGTSPGYGDIYPTSSRGPTMAGDPKPDIIATGAFTVSSTPINSGTGTDIWMGPGLASSTASGILALVHDAYFEAVHTARKEFVLNASANTTEAQLYHRPVVAGTLTVWIDGVETTAFSLDAETGIITFDSNVTIGEVITATYDFKDQFPDVESGRSILMSGADDMNYDPMSQGAGYCNAAESTKIASTTGGARVTPNRWTPGDYKGTLYDYFIKLYSSETKDENMKKEFTIENYDLFAINAHVHAGVMEKTGETLYIVETTKTKQSSWTVLNADGIFDKEGNMLGSINSTLWENAGLVKITASSD